MKIDIPKAANLLGISRRIIIHVNRKYNSTWIGVGLTKGIAVSWIS